MVEFAPLRFQSKILHDTQDEGELWMIFSLNVVGWCDFILLRKLTLIYSLVYDFCSSGQSFAHWGTFGPLKSDFLQIPPHDGNPCLWLNLPATGRLLDFHPRERALTGRTKKSGSKRNFFWAWFLQIDLRGKDIKRTSAYCYIPQHEINQQPLQRCPADWCSA